MSKDTDYRISNLTVHGLWGHKDLNIDFSPDVNILIGPNASGKTTILNILHYLFSGRLLRLSEIEFLHAKVELEAFTGDSRRTVSVQRQDGGLRVDIWRDSYQIDLPSLPAPPHRIRRARHDRETRQLVEHLRRLVPSVWLPVNRRLPITQDEEDEYLPYGRRSRSQREDRGRLESVDHKLKELLEELSRYRLQLDSRLSRRYKDFEREVLQLLLYNEEYDREPTIAEPPTEEDKKQLLRAFEEANLLGPQMRQRITEHFKVANATISRFNEDREGIPWQDLSILPLIRRTKRMVTLARELERDRDKLFDALNKYQNIVNEFFNNKNVQVNDSGELDIEITERPDEDLAPIHLSSGEKQILILLTQALLMQDQPVVYVADEPELSLHVRWQNRLLNALDELGGEIQLLVATHSPDIVGEYRNNVIRLSQ